MGNTASRDIFGNKTGPNTGTGLDTLAKNQGAMREGVGMLPPKEVTIIDGAISGFEEAALIVDTEGGAAADDLNVISPVISVTENLHPGMLITLRAKDHARVVTIKNSVSPNGINTADGNDIVLSPDWELPLRLVGGRWYEVRGRSSALAEEAQEDATTALGRTAPATTTSRGIGRVATLADMEPDAVIENGPAFLDSELLKTAPPSGTTFNPGWIGTMLCNVRTVITVSGTFTAPVSGWYRVTAIGGGGGGGKGSYAESTATNGGSGGSQGGTTSFGALVSAIGGSGGAGAASGASQGNGGGGGGGGAGIVSIRYIYLTKDTSISVVIGAGGAGGTAITGVRLMGGSGAGPSAGIGGNFVPGQGAVGAGNGLNGPGEPGSGGNGGINGLGYGGGGGGGAGQEGSRNDLLTPGGVASEGGTGGQGTTATSPSATTAGNGGAGGPGAIILEYFDPSVTS